VPEWEEDVVKTEVFGIPNAALSHLRSTTTDVIGVHPGR
jgi:hypothetical protein